MSETFPVRLAVYDLSRGMARSLSAQFLGIPLDIIPHTAIIVYGMEYFFGAGIQCESPASFRQAVQMVPLQEIDLGRTSVTQPEFEAWCVGQMNATFGGQYTAAAYDLFHRNCNHFSHDAALQGLRLSQGVPQDILGVPQRVLASPMGQVIRPMLQNMQVTRAEGSETVHAPFHTAAGSSVGIINSGSSHNKSASTSSKGNPWATVASSPQHTRIARAASQERSSTGATNAVESPCLDSFTTPLLSKETNMLSLCATKLSSLSDDRDETSGLNETVVVLSKESKEASLSQAMVDSSCRIIMHSFSQNKGTAFALLFLRILVLQYNSDSKLYAAVKDCLVWVLSQLTTTAAAALMLQTPAARSAAWLTCANAIGSYADCLKVAQLESLVDVATADVSLNENLPVRQAACAFLYNAALDLARSDANSEQGDDLDDIRTSLLCSSLSFAEEADGTCRLRRLMAIGKLLKPSAQVNRAAKSLLVELGVVETLSQIVLEDTGGADHAKCRLLAGELMQLLTQP